MPLDTRTTVPLATAAAEEEEEDADEEVGVPMPPKHRTRHSARPVAAALAAVGLALVALALATAGTPSREGGVTEIDKKLRELWDPSEVPCGMATCNCDWATGGPDGFCSKVDSPRTQCWSCCCHTLFPDDYQRAISAQSPQWGLGYPMGQNFPHSYGRDPYVVRWRRQSLHEDYRRRPDRHEEVHQHFWPGQAVRVEDRVFGELWRRGVVVRGLGQNMYKVRFDDGRRSEVVPSHRLAEDDCLPWWKYAFYTFLAVLAVLACVGLATKLVKPKPKPVDVYAEPPVGTVKGKRNCSACG